MDKLTKEETIRRHREMWRWIAEEIVKRKRVVEKKEYFDAMGIDTEERPLYMNYCCEYTKAQGDSTDCGNCPIFWGRGTQRQCNSEKGIYTKWLYATIRHDWEEAAVWAKIIAELLERMEG